MTTVERVQVFLTTSGIPKILDGTLELVEEDAFFVRLETSEVSVGGQAVLNFPDSERQRVMTRLDSVDGVRHRFVESHRVEPDKRNFPRLYAGIQVLYRPMGSSDDWFTCDEYMNFSVSGLAFDGSGDVPSGSEIELNIRLANVAGEWSAVGKVIRCDAMDVEEMALFQDGETYGYSLAVAFVTLPEACREALEALTLRLLDV